MTIPAVQTVHQNSTICHVFESYKHVFQSVNLINDDELSSCSYVFQLESNAKTQQS